MFIFAQNPYYSAGDEFGGIGSFFKKIGVAAAGFIPGVGPIVQAGADALLNSGGGGGGVAKGLAGINAFGAQVIGALEQLKGAAAQNPDEAVSQARQLLASLSDGSKVYQPKKGKDAAALAGFKSQATALVAQIEQIATAAATQQAQQAQQAAAMQSAELPAGVVQLPNGQFIAAPAAAGGFGGVDQTTLLMFGGALVLVVLLTRK